jgi:hypothetical protein
VERANSVIFFGKGGDIAINRRDQQEPSVLYLPVLQAALVYVDTPHGAGRRGLRLAGTRLTLGRGSRVLAPWVGPRDLAKNGGT